MRHQPPPLRDEDRLRQLLLADDLLARHPRCSDLALILTGPTGTSSAGFPYICQSSFQRFLGIPHLFQKGQALLRWLAQAEFVMDGVDDLSSDQVEGLARATRVMRTMVFTAAVTSPSDLWLVRHVLSAHKEVGLVDRFIAGESIRPEREQGFNSEQLRWDLQLLRSRGYLKVKGETFTLPEEPAINTLWREVQPLPAAFMTDMTRHLIDVLNDRPKMLDGLTESFLTLPVSRQSQHDWRALNDEIELGYRLLPLVLALRANGMTGELGSSMPVPEHLAGQTVQTLFRRAGMVTAELRVTELGGRVFARGPGPFGIIGTYFPYMNHLVARLKGGKSKIWVQRAGNVVASQDANRKTFKLANHALDAFCCDTGFSFDVFIEHAVGRGEATRQRYTHDGEDEILYFGADLEDAAIDRAVEQQAKGILPSNMRFVRRADIAEPSRIIEAVRQAGRDTYGAVMMVGNGFHEVRGQSDARMIDVFKGYQDAGIVLIFTEESALSDEDLIQTAWNTYHAGFRYVHAISGQGLRPADERPSKVSTKSWSRCAQDAGYVRLETYTRRTRTIYPYPRPRKHNPAISVTHFCVPGSLLKRLSQPQVKRPRTGDQ